MYNKEYNEHMEMKRQNEVLRNNERILKEKIEELKKKNKDLCENYCPRNKDSIPKQKIRDKIEELEEMKLDNDDVFGQMKKYAVLVLKEILGEDEK